jgi:hypothetical protein
MAADSEAEGPLRGCSREGGWRGCLKLEPEEGEEMVLTVGVGVSLSVPVEGVTGRKREGGGGRRLTGVRRFGGIVVMGRLHSMG